MGKTSLNIPIDSCRQRLHFNLPVHRTQVITKIKPKTYCIFFWIGNFSIESNYLSKKADKWLIWGQTIHTLDVKYVNK